MPQNLRSFIEKPGELNEDGEEVGDKVVPLNYEKPKPAGGKLPRREMRKPHDFNPEPPMTEAEKRKTLKGGSK